MATQIVHFEIPFDDTAAGKAFWGGLFGWEFQPGPAPPGQSYEMARVTETSGAALTDMEGGKRGARAYFDVPDIEAAIARVRELGGESGERMPVPAMGWFATCTDPHGNEFGLWQSDESAPQMGG
jgi:predicted enzyme related to lactoylglutathione lyase